MIEVNHLVKKYGGFVAVDDLSFRVEEGEIVGLLGPNGAGKSTTMNMMTGYISSNEGNVVIDGYDIFEEPEKAKKRIGYLPEQPPLYMDMTVYEYLKFVAQLKGVAKEKQREMLLTVMEETKLTLMQRRLIRNLSKGYKQRVGIAGALIGNPAVIILDEPTVGLDPKQMIEIRDLIRRLSEKHTIILSSHILSEVSAVCDRIMIINKGRLIVDDTPEGLSKHAEKKVGVRIVVKGEGNKVVETLTRLSMVSEVKVEEKEKDLVTVFVYGENNVDRREEVFYALAEDRIPIYAMQEVGVSLEDVFLELTKEEECYEESEVEEDVSNL